MIKLKQLSNICYYLLVINIIAIMCFSYKTETIGISYVTYIVSTFAMLIHIAFRNEKITFDKFHMALITFLVWCIASNLWSIAPDVSFISTFTMVQLTVYGLILYEFLRYSGITTDKLILALGVGVLAMGIYSLFYYGVGDFFESIISGRRIGFEINQENTFSTFACLGSLSWFGLYINEHKTKYIFFLLFSVILIFAGGSRGALLSFFSCFVISIINVRGIKRNFSYLILSLALSVPLIYFIEQNSTSFDVIQRLSYFLNIFSITGNVDNSALLRINMITFGIEKFFENPIFGFGLNCFSQLLLGYLGFSTYSHNNFIEMLCDLGLVGFVLYYSIYYLVWRERNKLNTTLLILTLFTFFNGMFSPNYYSKILFIIFAFCVGSSQRMILLSLIDKKELCNISIKRN